MLVRLRLIDPGGTTHEVGGVRYHFGPRPDLPEEVHVAEVGNPDHVARFLSIDGFEAFGDAPAETGAVPDFSVMGREELALVYRNLFGRSPHWRLGEETMRERIRAGTED